MRLSKFEQVVSKFWECILDTNKLWKDVEL